MAGSSSTYQEALKLVEEYLINANDFTERIQERLQRLGEFAGILASMKKEKDEVKEASTKQCTHIIWNLCENVLFGCFLVFTTKIADRFSMVSEMESKQKEDKSSKLPETMQIKIDEIKHYLEKARERLEKIDDLLSDFLKKIREAYKKRFNIPDEEIADLEIDASDVNFELEACKNYLDDAEREIKLLESDINKAVTRFGVKVVAGAAGVASVVIIAGVTIPGSEIIRWSLNTIVEKLGGLLKYVTGLTVLALSLSFKLIIDSHRTSYMVHVERLQSELRKVRSEYDLKQKEIDDKVTKRMEGMPKH